MLLVSVHLPKTAGQTFGRILRTHYAERFRLVKEDRPLHDMPGRRKFRALLNLATLSGGALDEIDCIHGHFLPVKFLGAAAIRPVQFVTWLRDPVQRLVSHYQYWKRTAPISPEFLLHHRMLAENWSLERFTLGEEMHNFYSQFFWRFPRQRLAFVGIVEHFDDDLAWFCQSFLGHQVQSQTHNVNPAKSVRETYSLDPHLERDIRAFHARDVELYEWAVSSRAGRGGGTSR